MLTCFISSIYVQFPLNGIMWCELKIFLCLFLCLDCIKPQLQAVSCKKHDLSANHRFKYMIIPCVLMACAAVIMFLNIKMIKKTKEKYIIKKKLVQTDESI